MNADISRIRAHIQNFAFDDLFIEELGWDNYHDTLHVPVDDDTYQLTAIAEKRGMVAFKCDMIPADNTTRRKIERWIARSHRENIIVYTDADGTEQVWQWVRREPGKPLANRERRFTKGKPGENIAQVLASIVFSLDEEEDLTIVDVTSRVRAAFNVEKVTKKFYDKFKKQHDAFLKFIDGIPDADLQRWYASVMMNRLMFIYFVQKKGLLDGNIHYLRDKLAESEGSFYHGFLTLLFFEGLAKKAEDRSPEARAKLGTIPYLNGGLFMLHSIEEQYGDALQIPDEAFEKLFAFFDEYRWHLDERPLRNDDEINPDVLGYIFEKYINQKQMGAYYTKEDITEYISKNTIIPFLFDQARQAVPIAFEGAHTVWELLQADPDRYIYPAVQHGVEHDLPENIAAGIDDVSQRDDWNTPAPAEYGLPTEIWRETVARRQRYNDICDQIERGEVTRINDLITLNLDIQQFAQDVIDQTDSTDVIRAFWEALNAVSVLDPTCGSGAFLFAALNILEPLYEICIERMTGFVADLKPDDPATKLRDFKDVLGRMDAHPNHRYFILKSIVVNNLYGVDIMEEAVEIAKLRLFLKLVAQVDTAERIEPLPDIDFNIRSGNTLVGFATQDEFAGRLFAQSVLPRIETLTNTVAMFRREQLAGNATAEQMATLKRKANAALKEIKDVLDQNLMEDYGQSDLPAFRRSHQPFHWFVEFYDVIRDGGFDVIIGNPPYVQYRIIKKEYTIREEVYKSLEAKNLYANCMERATHFMRENAWFGMIVPTSVIGLDKTESLRKVMLSEFSRHYCSTYGIRPSKLFVGVDQRLCVYIAQGGKLDKPEIFTTQYYRWHAEGRENLFTTLQYHPSYNHSRLKRIPQIGTPEAYAILEKIEHQKKTLASYYTKSPQNYKVHYHRSPRYWIRSINFEPYFKSAKRSRSIHHIRDLEFSNETEGKVAASLMNSSLFFFWFVSVGNGRNITGTDVEEFPFGEVNGIVSDSLPPIFDRLMRDYQDNSIIRVRKDQEYQEFDQKPSKPVMDEIDRVLARHYGFTDAELDFIINYDIKYRMGDDLFEEEGE